MVSESIEIVTVVFRLVEKREGPADAQLVAPEAAVPVERVGEGGPAFADVLGKGEEKIYVYDGILYGTWEMTREAGEQDADLRVAWNAVESNGVSLSDAGFTEYTPVDGEYVCYYFYRIVHNDDGADASAVPGPMKYAVVRNNVYKIAVEAVTAFGLTDNTPTEDEYSYMMVTVDVVPWVDREYEIVIDE